MSMQPPNDPGWSGQPPNTNYQPWQPQDYSQPTQQHCSQPFGQPQQNQQQPQWAQQPEQFQPPSKLARPKHSRRRLWIVLSIIGGVLVLSCIICSVAVAMTPSSRVQTPTPTAATQGAVLAAVTMTPTLTPIATATATPSPIPTATPTPRPVIQPTPTPKPQPTPTPHRTGVNGNPWGYDFNPGNLIYTPPSGFCSYFNCIPTFYGSDDPGDVYVVECSDSTYSQSGGESGACSSHGGVMRPLYSH